METSNGTLIRKQYFDYLDHHIYLKFKLPSCERYYVGDTVKENPANLYLLENNNRYLCVIESTRSNTSTLILTIPTDYINLCLFFYSWMLGESGILRDLPYEQKEELEKAKKEDRKFISDFKLKARKCSSEEEVKALYHKLCEVEYIINDNENDKIILEECQYKKNEKEFWDSYDGFIPLKYQKCFLADIVHNSYDIWSEELENVIEHYFEESKNVKKKYSQTDEWCNSCFSVDIVSDFIYNNPITGWLDFLTKRINITNNKFDNPINTSFDLIDYCDKSLDYIGKKLKVNPEKLRLLIQEKYSFKIPNVETIIPADKITIMKTLLHGYWYMNIHKKQTK